LNLAKGREMDEKALRRKQLEELGDPRHDSHGNVWKGLLIALLFTFGALAITAIIWIIAT